jgi:hypothetical protein
MLLELINSDFYFLGAAHADIASSTKDGAKYALDFANSFWSNIFQMGLFGRVVLAAQPIVAAGVIYRGYYMVQEAGKNSLDLEKVIAPLLTLIFTIVMLNQSGAYAMYTVIGLRNYTGGLSDTLMAGISTDFQRFTVSSGVTSTIASTLDPNLNAELPMATFKTELNRCATSKDPNCIPTAIDNLENNLQAVGINATTAPEIMAKVASYKSGAVTAASSTDPNAIEGFINAVKNPGDAIGNTIANAFQELVRIILTGLALAFFFAIELAMLVFGLTFPINIALSLFSPEPLKSWFGNFWSLINAKLCFSIITGIIVYLQLWMESRGGNPGLFVIEFLLAIFAPVATFFYCQGSALALAGALNSIASAPIRGAASGAMRVGGAAAKSFGGAIATRTLGVAGTNIGNNIGAKLAKKMPIFKDNSPKRRNRR